IGMDPEGEALLLLQEARESVEAARSYRRELQQRLRGLQQARKQIRESAALTRDVLEQHFNDLKGTLWKLLDERLVLLLQEVDAIEQESIKPLDECQKLIEHGVSTADDLLQEGECVIHEVMGEQNEKLCNFTKKALHIQLDSLPEVPALVDVPCLSAQLDDCLLTIVKNQIFSHGTVASRPPVQIEELTEKPGGILVRWCKVDDDFIPQDYRLQYRKSTANHFEDVYVGSEMEFIVLHIDPNVDYQFRVCARGDGRQEWSPWSIPQTGRSTLVPHEWTAGLEGYSLSSRRNIALRNDSQSCGVLYSKAPTYFCGQTLTFRQPDKRRPLTSAPDHYMTNQLPAVTCGSTVTFDMEVVHLGPNSNEGGNTKLRVTISSNNREVVFDWVLDHSCGSLYFGCSFSYPGWKVLVF
uniref:Cytokine receptor-like factor 3 n=1 Tax=Gopherus evgoodei TaxID=1825980 RepID=A0A8C4WRQ7_9SAUR